MSVPTLQCAEEIQASSQALFALTQDYEHRLDWDPFLREARVLDAREVGVGVKTWCVAWFGPGMETEYVSLNAPRVAAVKMTRGPWFLERFAASWQFDERVPVATDSYSWFDFREPGVTLVTFRYYITIRPRWLKWVLEPVCILVFRYEMRKRLRGLKRFVEAGRR